MRARYTAHVRVEMDFVKRTHHPETAEEFDEQRYEGGCTWFGRWTCAAWRTELTRLARALGTAEAAPSCARPRPAAHEVEALRHRSQQAGRSLGLFSRRAAR